MKKIKLTSAIIVGLCLAFVALTGFTNNKNQQDMASKKIYTTGILTQEYPSQSYGYTMEEVDTNGNTHLVTYYPMTVWTEEQMDAMDRHSTVITKYGTEVLAPNWTAENYEEWLEIQFRILPTLVGTEDYEYDKGTFVWTQKMVDDRIALYESYRNRYIEGTPFIQPPPYMDIQIDNNSFEIALETLE